MKIEKCFVMKVDGDGRYLTLPDHNDYITANNRKRSEHALWRQQFKIFQDTIANNPGNYLTDDINKALEYRSKQKATSELKNYKRWNFYRKQNNHDFNGFADLDCLDKVVIVECIKESVLKEK